MTYNVGLHVALNVLNTASSCINYSSLLYLYNCIEHIQPEPPSCYSVDITYLTLPSYGGWKDEEPSQEGCHYTQEAEDQQADIILVTPQCGEIQLIGFHILKNSIVMMLKLKARKYEDINS